VKLGYAKNLVQLGIKFFIIQISSLIVFTTDNIIITQIFTPGEVTVYNVAYKYFNIIPLVFGVILTPFWSAYTEAYAKKDFQWIRMSTKKLLKIWIIFVLVILVMLGISREFYGIWTESRINVPFILSAFMGLFAIIQMWNNIFTYFINGVGKIKLQLYLSSFAGILNIPLSIMLAKTLNLGVTGVIIATSVCMLFGTFLIPIQYYKILNQKDEGIWGQ
jgi:O-antigen/teichoic acid export membrane protein